MFKLAGGRGLDMGEKGLKTEEGVEKLFADPAREAPAEPDNRVPNPNPGSDDVYIGSGKYIKADAAAMPAKEDVGVFKGATGGFAGGEANLWKFRDEIKEEMAKDKAAQMAKNTKAVISPAQAPMRPPLLMPGMNAICINPKHQYHMFTGIVQRVTDGKAQVLFEGGNWDKSITFRLEDLERSKTGPPALHPKSAILTEKVEQLKKLDEARAAAVAANDGVVNV